MKKVWKGAAAVVAALSLGVTGFVGASSAYAADAVAGPCAQQPVAGRTCITVNSNNSHTYDVWQIFTGTHNANGTWSNLSWGAAAKKTGKKASDKDLKTLESALNGKTTDKDKVDALETLKDFVNITDAGVITGTPAGQVSAATPLTVDEGFYLLTDATADLDKEDAYSLLVALPASGATVEVTKKFDAPTVEKKVKDDEDDEGNKDWNDSADYGLDEEVPFQLTATLGDRIADYDSYKLVFHDTLSAGLTPKLTNGGTVNATLNGKTVPFTVAFNYEDGKATTITFTNENIKGATRIEAADLVKGNKVVIEYKAKLNKHAVHGSAGNDNKVELEYSNNPDSDQTDTTKPDYAIVFTYKVVVDKVDGDNKPLSGAIFKLTDADGNVIDAVTATDGTRFTFNHLDEGTYTLTETTAPYSYQKIDPITFVISAEHQTTTGTGATHAKLTSLTATNNFTGNKDEGSVTKTVINTKNSQLPLTGGMGTVVLYTVGGLIVLIAGVGLAVALRRRQA